MKTTFDFNFDLNQALKQHGYWIHNAQNSMDIGYTIHKTAWILDTQYTKQHGYWIHNKQTAWILDTKYTKHTSQEMHPFQKLLFKT